MNRKPIVGERLFSLNVGNAARNAPQVLTPVIVATVGRKYFTTKPEGGNWSETTYHIDEWTQKTDYIADSCLYETEQQYADEKETSAICAEIGCAFIYGENHKNLTLSELRKISEILNK